MVLRQRLEMNMLIGKRAPYFHAKAMHKGQIIDLKLSDFEGKYLYLLFYPLDFTFVCPTELFAFEEMRESFEERGCQILAASVDSVHTHSAWWRTPQKQGGIQGVQYPILSDLSRDLGKAYGVLHPEEPIHVRASFLIDRQGIVRAELRQDLPLGRSPEEALRLLDALRFHEEHGEVCPASWKKGAKGMKASHEGLLNFLNS